jgi:hypothetical protein
LDTLLIETLGDHLNGSESMKGIILALRKKAASGDVRAAELLLDRAYGKLKLPTSFEFDLRKIPENQLDQIINRILNIKIDGEETSSAR